jgi:hypothetical protein
MRFSKPFIAIACILLVLVGATLGYSIRMLQGICDIDRELKFLKCESAALGCRVFLLETSQITMERSRKPIYASHGLDRVGRKGQLLPLPTSNVWEKRR